MRLCYFHILPLLTVNMSILPGFALGLAGKARKPQRGRWPHSLPPRWGGTARRCHEVPGSTGQADSKTKTDPFGSVFVLELLPGFEPGTSSLPIEPSLIFLEIACCILMPQSIGTAGFFFLPCLILLPLNVFSRSGFYAIRSGFCSGRCAGDSVGEIVAARLAQCPKGSKWSLWRKVLFVYNNHSTKEEKF